MVKPKIYRWVSLSPEQPNWFYITQHENTISIGKGILMKGKLPKYVFKVAQPSSWLELLVLTGITQNQVLTALKYLEDGDLAVPDAKWLKVVCQQCNRATSLQLPMHNNYGPNWPYWMCINCRCDYSDLDTAEW